MIKVREIPRAALDLIKRFEGFSPRAYICPAGLKTIGYGHVIRQGEIFPDNITQAEGEAILQKDLLQAAKSVIAMTNVPLTDGQYAALISFVFNVGAGAFQRSTMRSCLNRGEYMRASEEFPKWVRSGGRILKGLVYRREAERVLFLSEADDEE